MNLVFLYTRLPGYFANCLRFLSEHYADVKVHCIVQRPSTDAPYVYDNDIVLHYRDEVPSVADLVQSLNPQLIYVAGWSDSEYNAVAKRYVTRIPVIAGMDNPWRATVRQILASLVYGRRLRKCFNYLWVPGAPQYAFASRLGYNHSQILNGLYAADVSSLLALEPSGVAEKTVLFAGRLVNYKHPEYIVRAFRHFNDQRIHTDWKALIVGNGELKGELQRENAGNPQVSFIDFVQPAELKAYYQNARIFCLPSDGEHWGVVIQEAAAAGLPLLVSDSCGAASTFLINGYNGYSFQNKNYLSFVDRLGKLFALSDDELAIMGERSRELAKRITPATWAAELMSVLNSN